MYHICLVIHSLSCFHISVIMNKAVTNLVYMFLYGHVFQCLLGIYLEVELLSHMLTPMFNLLGTARQFPKQLNWFIVPPEMEEYSNFSTSTTTLIIMSLLNYTHPSGYEVVSDCVFYLHFPNPMVGLHRWFWW